VLRKWPLCAVASGLVLLAFGCTSGGSPAGTQAATASTFMTDRAVVSGFRSMVSDASGASLFAASGAGGSQAADCAATWGGIRDRVVRRDAKAASDIDGAVAQLQSATATRDASGAAAATATIAATARDYTKQYP
jgi:hypothetical protein